MTHPSLPPPRVTESRSGGLNKAYLLCGLTFAALFLWAWGMAAAAEVYPFGYFWYHSEIGLVRHLLLLLIAANVAIATLAFAQRRGRAAVKRLERSMFVHHNDDTPEGRSPQGEMNMILRLGGLFFAALCLLWWALWWWSPVRLYFPLLLFFHYNPDLARALVFILLYAALVPATVGIAKGKSRSLGKWLVFALLCPVLSLIVAAVVDDYVHPRDRYATALRKEDTL